MRALSAGFHLLAACGVGFTAWRVVPWLWDINVIDCLIVGTALAIAVVMQIHKALTGEWPS